MPSLGNNLLRPVELGSIDPHAMQNDRELTSDATLALRNPLRLASFAPKPSRRTISGRGSAEPRLLQIDNSAAWRHRIWRFDPDQSTSPEAWRLQVNPT